MQNRSLLLLCAALALAVGCSEHSPAPSAEPPASTAASAPVAPPAAPASAAAPRPQDHWLGRWAGPEGTFIDISRDGDGYALAIQDLDGLTRYAGRAAGEDRIEFERQGRVESLRATSGEETGMKWLLDKRDCLTVATGEGFCRD